MIGEPQFEQDLRAIATLYGIDITLPYERLVEAVEEAGQCGAWEIVQHCLYSMDYPVRLPKS